MANISESYDAASSGRIDILYEAIQQDPHILEEVDAAPSINTPLHAAASSGRIDTLYEAIQHDPRILEEVDVAQFVNTPLHAAAFAGRLEFSIEIMRLKPSFGSKLNQQGLSPIHVALQNNQHNVVRRLVEINKELVRVKGREGVTPLHFVCQSGDGNENITLLIDLLEVCPDSIQDVNVRNETALHIALRNENLRAFQVLLGWLNQNAHKDAGSLRRSILNWKDSAGNTILHIATLKDNQQAVALLIEVVKINAKNLENQTALDLAETRALPMMAKTLMNAGAKHGASVDDDSNREDKLRSESSFFTSRLLKLKHFILNMLQMNEEKRNAVMVVGALMITAIYQTVLSPPGGLTQGPNSNNVVNATSSNNSTFTATAAGKPVLPRDVFRIVAFLNSIVFIIAFYLIVGITPHGPSSLLVSIPLTILLASYLVSLLAIWP